MICSSIMGLGGQGADMDPTRILLQDEGTILLVIESAGSLRVAAVQSRLTQTFSVVEYCRQ